MVRELMLKTKTSTGLKVYVSINHKTYKTGLGASKGYKISMAIVFDYYLPVWNYTAIPATKTISFFYHMTFLRDKAYETQTLLKQTIHTLQEHFPET